MFRQMEICPCTITYDLEFGQVYHYHWYRLYRCCIGMMGSTIVNVPHFELTVVYLAAKCVSTCSYRIYLLAGQIMSAPHCCWQMSPHNLIGDSFPQGVAWVVRHLYVLCNMSFEYSGERGCNPVLILWMLARLQNQRII